MKSIEMTANSYDEAVSLALAELGLTAEQVDVENLKESGLIRKKYTVRVTQKITTDIIAKNFVQGVIDKIGLECTAEVTEDDTAITVTLSGKDANVLIGYRGEALDSLQYLTLLVANKSNPAGKRIVLDGENYREKRTVTLSKLAKKLAFSAAKNCEVINLEPMNPFERRIIHSALHDDKFVTTSSVGEEPNRYVVITPNRKERRPYDPNRAPRDNNHSNYSERSNYGSKPNYDSKPSSSASNAATYNPRPTADGKPYNNSRPSYGDKPAYNNSRPSYGEKSTYSNNSSYNKPQASVAPTETKNEAPSVPAEQGESKDMYNQDVSRNFRKNGASKMRSFGAPKTKYF